MSGEGDEGSGNEHSLVTSLPVSRRCCCWHYPIQDPVINRIGIAGRADINCMGSEMALNILSIWLNSTEEFLNHSVVCHL